MVKDILRYWFEIILLYDDRPFRLITILRLFFNHVKIGLQVVFDSYFDLLIDFVFLEIGL